MENHVQDDTILLHHHRDLFIFIAYTGGIRISDLPLMRWKHFDGDHFNFQIKKTWEDLRIKLPENKIKMSKGNLFLAKYYHGF
jgi:integrase/recombinase XerD